MEANKNNTTNTTSSSSAAQTQGQAKANTTPSSATQSSSNSSNSNSSSGNSSNSSSQSQNSQNQNNMQGRSNQQATSGKGGMKDIQSKVMEYGSTAADKFKKMTTTQKAVVGGAVLALGAGWMALSSKNRTRSKTK